MEVILHFGAHRTGASTFQDYMRRHADALAARGVAFWGPRVARNSLWSRDIHNAARRHAKLRVHRLLDHAERSGIKTFIVSDQNMIGELAVNVRQRCLYPAVSDRVAHVADVFEGRITGVMFSSRSLEVYWSSALSSAIACGHRVPNRVDLHEIATGTRGWREVITDISHALPTVPLQVLPFEDFSARPDVFLARGAGVDAPFDAQRQWLQRSPTLPALRRVLNDQGASPSALPFGMERWNPFTNEEHAILREKHADDMMWLIAGADGLATLTDDRLRNRAGSTLPSGATAKGQRDDLQERHMARPG